MKKLSFLFITVFIFITNAYSQDKFFQPDDLFYIDHMDSHNKEFSLYFKGREKSILARGENDNYINDYPKDLYIFDHLTKSSSPLISTIKVTEFFNLDLIIFKLSSFASSSTLVI